MTQFFAQYFDQVEMTGTYCFATVLAHDMLGINRFALQNSLLKYLYFIYISKAAHKNCNLYVPEILTYYLARQCYF